ncbi:hypothetical protein SAMN05892883_1610 [Jatrophihabitans sp. GAS493]|uniref:hypothetical protein n=1 Tax=Jatrophihabitans sp. GAS493 TaxID=1907575 RepID=UPI000BC0848C|nr:hypothetical protein [Jatrophihabitans sp. GAS493]SOD72189.1 hypothetical protein SAMN05892883_1610 [Jatrophihabitans sp. GAS493]
MTPRLRASALLLGGAILLAGCASSHADPVQTLASAGAGRSTSGMAMTPGMVMPDGSTMGVPTPLPSAAAVGPSEAAREICSTEIRNDIAQVLALKSIPAPSATWAEHVYTCTYQLPMGMLVLSVTEAADDAAAQTFAATLRTHLADAHNVAGLTTTAFATPNGRLALVKDNDTLQIDATRLPAQFGSQDEKRTDFAYEVASDVLGCWTGDSS